MTTTLDKWTITRKGNSNKFKASFLGHPVANVTILKGGKAWTFENLDDMSDSVVAADQRTILSFVLPMYGCKMPAELSFEEGDIFCTHNPAEEIFVYEVQLGRGVAVNVGSESRWYPMDSFLRMIARKGYEKAPSLAFIDYSAEAAERKAWLAARYRNHIG